MSGFEPEVDIKIEFTGLRPGEKLYEELLLEEEGLKATKHEKIYVAKPIQINFVTLKKEIEALKEIVMKDANGIKEYVESIVPTYKKESINKEEAFTTK